MRSRYEIDLTSGPFVKKIILFALPILGTSVLQLLFNAVDVGILGIFTSDECVAAVGSTTAAINLFTNFFIGFSLSTNILLAKSVGAQDIEKSQKIVGTSVLISIIIGAFCAMAGYIFAEDLLNLLKCDPELIEKATVYLKIYFLGMPIIMLYNFAASILRAVGDTLRPLIFLVIGGIINVGLNILFILGFNKDVEGVAIATVVSQAITAALSLVVLVRNQGHAHLETKKLRLFKEEFWEILKKGFPMGLQSSMFSISNAVVASTINSWGKIVVAANTIALQFDSIIYSATDAFAISTMSFVAQNIGAKKIENLWPIIRRCFILTAVISLAMGAFSILFGEHICAIMTDDAQVISYAKIRINYMSMFYFLAGIMNVFGNVLRGTGKTLAAAICSLSCTCLFRILWLKLIYPMAPSVEMIYLVYPISWVLCMIAYLIVMFPTLKKLNKA